MKAFKPLVILIKISRESMQFAYHAISVNKLRTFLSLFGITIGIFAIISVYTILDSLENNVRDSIQSLGDNVVYVQKWPWGAGGGEYPWWKYLNRPQPSFDDLEEIQRRSLLAGPAVFNVAYRTQLKFIKNDIPEGTVIGVSNDYDKIRVFDIENGRFFSLFEFNAGRSVALIGSEIAKELFQEKDPLGEFIKLGGRKVKIIGVLKKEGKSAIGENSHDNLVVVPVEFAKTMVDFDRSNPWIQVKAKENVAVNDLMDELRGILRSHRRLKPLQEDNFALNQIDLIKEGIENIFRVINFAGGFIAFFSIVVGGFGIANIMFVSVKERTNIIGIQKALGAKRSFILIQFLYESVLLAVVGGIIGLLLIFAGTIIVSNTSDFTISLTFSNIMKGIMISAIIGIVSGFLPAWVASRLSPVDAINTKT